MSPPHRIALVTVALDNVGPARAMLTLAEGLDRRRFVPHIITTVPPPLAETQRLERAGVPTASLDASGPFDLRAVVRLARLLRRWDIDLVHARLQRAGFFARLAALGGGRPAVLVNVVNMYGHHFQHQHGRMKGRLLRAIESATAPLVDAWIANSDAAAAELHDVTRVPRDRIGVIRNAIDQAPYDVPASEGRQIRRELGLGDAFVVGTVSRLVPLKRVELLIEAVARLGSHPINPVLLIVGDGPLRGRLERLANDAGVRAVFTGTRDDVPRLLSAMDVFLYGSESEGQPNAVLEAMVARRAVVAAAIPAVREVIADTVTGLLAEADPDALAAAVRRLAADPALRTRLGTAARATATGAYSQAGMIAAFEREYERVLAERGAR